MYAYSHIHKITKRNGTLQAAETFISTRHTTNILHRFLLLTRLMFQNLFIGKQHLSYWRNGDIFFHPMTNIEKNHP